jgi:rhodanese-related sulfurtransferase
MLTEQASVHLPRTNGGNDQTLPDKNALSVDLPTAWRLFSEGRAKLIDVRTTEERTFVGYVEGSIHVPLAEGTKFVSNPRFIGALGGKVTKDDVLLFLCRSGPRAEKAVAMARKAGFDSSFIVLEGFEGDLDERKQRSVGGWKNHGLPWIQE